MTIDAGYQDTDQEGWRPATTTEDMGSKIGATWWHIKYHKDYFCWQDLTRPQPWQMHHYITQILPPRPQIWLITPCKIFTLSIYHIHLLILIPSPHKFRLLSLFKSLKHCFHFVPRCNCPFYHFGYPVPEKNALLPAGLSAMPVISYGGGATRRSIRSSRPHSSFFQSIKVA